MKEKIQEVQNYFKTKLLRGEFEIVKREAYTYIVSIDEEYNFSIWMKNGPENRKLYKHADDNFMHIDLTEEESVLLHNLLVSDYKKFLVDELVNKKERELETLKQSLR
jgi:hypothetical protein